MPRPETPPHALGRGLRGRDVTLLGVGAIVGGGVFASMGAAAVGTAARPGAGPSLMLSIVVTALTCLLTALCYSELASLLPSAGSAYIYARQAFGRRCGWLIGWCITLQYAVANVAVALSWGDHVERLSLDVGRGLGLAAPAWASWHKRAAAAAFIMLMSLWLCRGFRESSRLNNLLVVAKVLVLLLFAVIGFAAVGPAAMVTHWQPFFPGGVAGTLQGAAVIFFAFIGFDAVATVAEEVHDPGRTLPRAICGSLAICALLYVLVAAALTGAAPPAELARHLGHSQGQPLTATLGLFGPRALWATPVVAVGALVAQTTALIAFQVAQARVLFAMGRDGLLPHGLCRVHPVHQTPAVATMWAGVLVAGIVLCGGGMDAMLDLTDMGTLFIFCVTNAAVPRLRQRLPHLRRAFAVPGGAWLCPIGGVLSCLGLMFCLPRQAWTGLAAWLGLGLGIDLLRPRLRRAKMAP